MSAYCKDCKWCERIELESPLTHKLRKGYVCTSTVRKRHYHARNQDYDLKEPCQKACKSGFEPKEK